MNSDQLQTIIRNEVPEPPMSEDAKLKRVYSVDELRSIYAYVDKDFERFLKTLRWLDTVRGNEITLSLDPEVSFVRIADQLQAFADFYRKLGAVPFGSGGAID